MKGIVTEALNSAGSDLDRKLSIVSVQSLINNRASRFDIFPCVSIPGLIYFINLNFLVQYISKRFLSHISSCMLYAESLVA